MAGTQGSLAGRVCLVTGASRGLGKGIALQLGEAGATVYITGRTLKSTSGAQGCLEETAKEVEKRGGRCIPVQCDHSKDEDIERLFDTIKREQNGRLDVLVNNAYAGVSHILKNMGKTFWEQDTSAWDIINNVGLRNHYICSTLAARLMVPRRSGLIVNVSSGGGNGYLFNVAYGVGKEACDRMAADCAFELRKHNVAYVSLWPGPVQTELFVEAADSGDRKDVKVNENFDFNQVMDMVSSAETPELSGRAIVALASDSGVMKKTGRTLMTADLSDEYGFTDIDGKPPVFNMRSPKTLLMASGYSKLAWFFPRWIKIPGWVLWLTANRL